MDKAKYKGKDAEKFGWWRFLKVVYVGVWLLIFLWTLGISWLTIEHVDRLNTENKNLELFKKSGDLQYYSDLYASGYGEDYFSEYYYIRAQTDLDLPYLLEKNNTIDPVFFAVVGIATPVLLIELARTAIMYILGIKGGHGILFRIYNRMYPDKKVASKEDFDERYKLLLKVIDKEKMIEIVKNHDDAALGLEQHTAIMNNFFDRTRTSREYFEHKDSKFFEEQPSEVIEEYFKLNDDEKLYEMAVNFWDEYLGKFDELDAELGEGLGVDKAKKQFAKVQKDMGQKWLIGKLHLDHSKIITKHIIRAKKKGLNEIKGSDMAKDIEKLKKQFVKD